MRDRENIYQFICPSEMLIKLMAFEILAECAVKSKICCHFSKEKQVERFGNACL